MYYSVPHSLRIPSRLVNVNKKCIWKSNEHSPIYIWAPPSLWSPMEHPLSLGNNRRENCTWPSLSWAVLRYLLWSGQRTWLAPYRFCYPWEPRLLARDRSHRLASWNRFAYPQKKMIESALSWAPDIRRLIFSTGSIFLYEYRHELNEKNGCLSKKKILKTNKFERLAFQ